MNIDHEHIWAAMPACVRHPRRVLVIEALSRTGQPLSPMDMVDVLDGEPTTLEAAYHLRVLETFGVVERLPPGEGKKLKGEDNFDLRFALKA